MVMEGDSTSEKCASDTEGYSSNPDMENFVDREFMKEMEENQVKEYNGTTRTDIPSMNNKIVSDERYEASATAVRRASEPTVVNGLPEPLVQAGWALCWSQRESRHYFFNSLTNQSLWEMPQLPPTGVVPKSPSGAAPFDDPLGLHSSGSSENDGGKIKVLKRRRSCEPWTGASQKISRIETYWDFEVTTDVLVMESAPCNLPPPTPESERYRATLTNQLRQHYQDMCHSREGIDAPHESFNRWILERKVVDRGCDPMLPTDCPDEVSPAMYREIMHDIPIRLSRIKYLSDARKQLFCYAEAAKKMIETRNTSAESRKQVKWQTEETFSWLRKEQNALLEDYLDRLSHLRRQCGPHLAQTAKSSVESICTKMYHMAREYSKKIFDRATAVLRENRIEIPPQPKPTASLVPATPCAMITLSPPLSGVTKDADRTHVNLTYKNEVLRINKKFMEKLYLCHGNHKWTFGVHVAFPLLNALNAKAHCFNVEHSGLTRMSAQDQFERLLKRLQPNSYEHYFSEMECLYRYGCHDDPSLSNFLPRVWCLLRRYQTIFGPNQYEGIVLQGALPIPVFKCLHDVFGVTMECFASPLNCYFKNYCSASVDTDSYFGSSGPILQFFPVSGSFEANAPFAEELMEAMVDHFEKLLAQSDKPLSFMVFVPEWRDPTPVATLHMENSRFKRKQVLIPAFEHEYRSGLQHIAPESEVYHKSVHGTLLFFLQNDAGFEKWGPTPARLRELLNAFQPKSRTCTEKTSPTSYSP